MRTLGRYAVLTAVLVSPLLSPFLFNWWLTLLDVTILKPYETLQSEDKRTGLEQSSGFPKAQATGSTPVGGIARGLIFS